MTRAFSSTQWANSSGNRTLSVVLMWLWCNTDAPMSTHKGLSNLLRLQFSAFSPIRSTYRSQAEHAPGSFEGNGCRHLGVTLTALGEDDGNLFDRVALLPSSVVKLDLKSIALRLDFVPFEIAQDVNSDRFESAGRIAHRQSRQSPHIEPAEGADKQPALRPVENRNTTKITRANRDVRALLEFLEQLGDWRAYSDGAQIPIFKAFGGLMAIPLSRTEGPSESLFSSTLMYSESKPVG